MKPSDYIRKGWTQGWFARDIDGNMVSERDVRAVCWCLGGAVVASGTCNSHWREVLLAQLDTIYPTKIPHNNLAAWNDDPKRTQQEVIDLLESVGL